MTDKEQLIKDHVSAVANNVKDLLTSLIEQDDEQYIEQFTLNVTKYLTLSNSDSPKVKKQAEETLNDLYMTAKLKLAQKQIKARRGMRDLIPSVIGTIIQIVKTATL